MFQDPSFSRFNGELEGNMKRHCNSRNRTTYDLFQSDDAIIKNSNAKENKPKTSKRIVNDSQLAGGSGLGSRKPSYNPIIGDTNTSEYYTGGPTTLVGTDLNFIS
jgi:hypothetical protein